MSTAVANQDCTGIPAYGVGRDAQLYRKNLEELSKWDGQSPPTPRHQKGKHNPRIQELIGKVGLTTPQPLTQSSLSDAV